MPRLLFSDIYVFGDSLSDTGNLLAAAENFLGATNELVLEFFAPYFEGRLSNGPVWVETLAPQLELTSDPNLNFAVTGATTHSFIAENTMKSITQIPELLSIVETSL